MAGSSAARLDGDLLALGLALDQVEHALAVRVLVLRGLEVARQRVDELLGHGQLLLGRLAVLHGDLVQRGPGSTTSSANSIVSIVRTGPLARMATRLSLERITTLPIATLPASSIAWRSSS